MWAGAGGSGPTGNDDRSWVLGCEGMRVDGPDGPVGIVVAPIYEPSARWDRPWGLTVEGPAGQTRLPIETVRGVDLTNRRITVALHRGE